MLNPKRLCHKFAESIDNISLKINEKPNPWSKPISPVTKIIFLCSFPNKAKNAAYIIVKAIVVSINGINQI